MSSWKILTNQLVTNIQTLRSNGEVTTKVHDDLIKYVGEIQKAIYDQYENPATTDEIDVSIFSLEKENAELKQSLESYREHYEQRIKELKEDNFKLMNNAGAYKKKYKRAKHLVISLTKFIEDMEDDENEA